MNPQRLNTKKKINAGKNLQYDLILQSIAEGVCVIDADESISFVNLSAGKMLGYDARDLFGRHYEEVLFNRACGETDFCPIRFALTDGETTHVKTDVLFRADKSGFAVEYFCVPVIEDGTITGAVITFEDVTERLDVERTIAQARDFALENARLKAAFLANMSHEIRTPLNGITGTADLLMQTELSEEQQKYVRMLNASALTLLETVNEILDFSKIEAGKFKVVSKPFDVRRMVLSSAELFSFSAKLKNIKMRVEIDENIPLRVSGDEIRLRQVLNNLLNNAVKFTEIGAIDVRVWIAEEKSRSLILQFDIIDTGIGIAEKARQNLFQPFVQADDSTTKLFGGTGLGLAICREIVEKMNGSISVETGGAGIGSRFWFTAEFGRDNTDAAPREDLTAPPVEFTELKVDARKSSPSFAALKVLIVEDNEINLEITKAMLAQNHVIADAAENGAKAVEICAANDYDVILMDCRMPVMNGLDATKAVRKLTADRPRPKIIALTAGATDAERSACFAAGMDGFLTKPFSPAELTEVLQTDFTDKNQPKNLDLEKDLVQHSFAEFISPEMLKKLNTIEARSKKAFVSDLFRLFVRHTAEKLTEMEPFIRAEDFRSVENGAHSLKGSSANLGVFELRKLFAQLETRAKADDAAAVQKKFSEIKDKFTKVKQSVE